MPSNAFAAVGQSHKLKLSSAILVYTGSDARESVPPLATIHCIGFPDDGPPILMPGEAITTADVEALSASLTKAAGTMSWLPPAVLSISPDRLVWHVPSHRRRIWFNAEAKAYRSLNGKLVTHPALIFDATINAGLRVLAVPTDQRPVPETPLRRGPYLNLYSLGEMCRGNSPMPKVFSIEAMKTYEDSFFNSAFSHSNLSGKALCRHPGGPVRMWQELLTRKKFPARWLATLDRAKGERAHHDDGEIQTVGDLLRPQKWTGHHPL